MRLLLRYFLFMLAFHASVVQGQHISHEKDFQTEWMIFQQGIYKPYEEATYETKAIYFSIPVIGTNRSSVLDIRSTDRYFLFINGKAAGYFIRGAYRIDSLAAMYGGDEIHITVYRPGLTKKNLFTTLRTKVAATDEAAIALPRPSTSFRDFVIVGALILLLVMIVVIRINTRVASEYFAVHKVFSLREEEDTQLSRIGSSTNILFYLYCSLLLGYYVLIAVNFLADQYALAIPFAASAFMAAILKWLKLTLLLSGVFLVKIILIFSLASLFGLREISAIHFFNWVRLLLLSFGILGMFMFIYFISHGSNAGVYAAMFKLIGWILGGWIVLIFLKLSGKVNASMFHLFSYICATELLPFLMIIKILYN